jgi:hypothetical protein
MLVQHYMSILGQLMYTSEQNILPLVYFIFDALITIYLVI